MENGRPVTYEDAFRLFLQETLEEARNWLTLLELTELDFENAFLSTLSNAEELPFHHRKKILDAFDQLIDCNNDCLPHLYLTISLFIDQLETMLDENLPDEESARILSRQFDKIKVLSSSWLKQATTLFCKLDRLTRTIALGYEFSEN